MRILCRKAQVVLKGFFQLGSQQVLHGFGAGVDVVGGEVEALVEVELPEPVAPDDLPGHIAALCSEAPASAAFLDPMAALQALQGSSIWKRAFNTFSMAIFRA